MIPKLKDMPQVIGKVVVGNLTSTCEEGLAPDEPLIAFHTKNKQLCGSPEEVVFKTPLHIACHIIWSDAPRFQLKGGRPADGPYHLVNIQSCGKIYEALAAQGVTPLPPSATDAQGLARYVMRARGNRRLKFGLNGLLLWLTRRDPALDILMPHEIGRDAKATRRLLNFVGLSEGYSIPPLVTSFNVTAANLISAGVECARPTTFDGISGTFFKQVYFDRALPEQSWGSALNINGLVPRTEETLDGAPEIVCRPLPIEFVESCYPLSPVLACHADTETAYAQKLLERVAPNGGTWEQVATALRESLNQLCDR